MMLAALRLLHGGDERMEWLYFWASIIIIALPVTIFLTMGWLVARQYFRDRRAAEKAAAHPSDVG